ncbi:hypothetical protein [Kaarinaea lacus]
MSKYLFSVLAVLMTSSCIAKKDIILPTKYDRTAQVEAYKMCVANATHLRFDTTTNADVLVKNSMSACSRHKQTMLRAYPKRWRENYIKDVDAELYQQEISWVADTRKNMTN